MSTTIPEYMPTLAKGGHHSGDGRACVMEYVSVLAGEEWTDHPKCTNNTIASVARALNDSLYAEKRSLLIPLIPRLLVCNTRGTTVTNKEVQKELNRFLRDYKAPWMKQTTAEAATKFFGWTVAGAAASINLLHNLGTDSLVVAVLSETGEAEDQVALLTALLDEFDRIIGRMDPVPPIDPERMTRAVCKVEGKPWPVAPRVHGIRLAIEPIKAKFNEFGLAMINASQPVAKFHEVYTEDDYAAAMEKSLVSK